MAISFLLLELHLILEKQQHIVLLTTTGIVQKEDLMVLIMRLKLRRSLTLKEKILGNFKENIVDQNQSDTLVDFTSCLDMNRDLSCDETIKMVKELHKIYFIDYVHEVEDQGQYEVAGWNVTIKYKAKIECSLNNLSNQFRALWPKVNKEWATMKKSNKGHHINTEDFWKHMLEQYAYLATEVFELINTVVSINITCNRTIRMKLFQTGKDMQKGQK